MMSYPVYSDFGKWYHRIHILFPGVQDMIYDIGKQLDYDCLQHIFGPYQYTSLHYISLDLQKTVIQETSVSVSL